MSGSASFQRVRKSRWAVRAAARPIRAERLVASESLVALARDCDPVWALQSRRAVGTSACEEIDAPLLHQSLERGARLSDLG